MRQTHGMIVAWMAALLLPACGGGGSSTPANSPPIANAGSAQIVSAGAAVTLSGAASSDADGSVVGYAWTQTAGTAVVLNGASTSGPGFTAPAAASTLTFRLVVTDNSGAASAASTVVINVNANALPVANAGAAQTVSSGMVVSLTGAASSDTDGSIAAYAWTQTSGTAVTLDAATTSAPSFVAPTVATLSTLTFSLVVTDNLGSSSAPSVVTITVNPAVMVTGTVRFARVPFLNSSPFGLDYANPVQRPSRGVLVRALDANNQVLATGITDASGVYSLPITGNVVITLQVVARLQRDSTQPLPRWDVRVQDGVPGTNPYTYTSAAFNSSVGVQDISIPSGLAANGTATGVRASGPFAILDTVYTTIQTVLSVSPTASFPDLIVDWGSQSVGTLFSTTGGQHIALLADLTEDTDEFDQHVIAHEFGHYIERNFSRSDSIGGSHTITDRLDPRVAFGEGFGYAFAAIALNEPIERDSFVDNGVHRGSGFNVEFNPPAPQAGSLPGCWCSEISVWSILWDLYDNTIEGSDSIALGFAPLWDVLINAQRNTPAATTIFSFIAGLNAARPADAPLINALVSAQNITAGNGGSVIDAFGTNETNNPLALPANALPVYTTITAGTPVVVRSFDDIPGRYNKVGNRRLLRFTPVVSGPVTVSLSTSNPAAQRDPDFYVFRSGTPVAAGTSDFNEYPEVATFNAVANTTYIIDAYDCANGCTTVQGTAGDYDLTVTIN